MAPAGATQVTPATPLPGALRHVHNGSQHTLQLLMEEASCTSPPEITTSSLSYVHLLPRALGTRIARQSPRRKQQIASYLLCAKKLPLHSKAHRRPHLKDQATWIWRKYAQISGDYLSLPRQDNTNSKDCIAYSQLYKIKAF